MAPTKCKTKHKPEKTKVGEEVLDLVISYIDNVEDRNSVSLVSRKFHEIEGIMRKRVTVHVCYSPNLASLRKRFPFIESLTLKGPLYSFHGLRSTPWFQLLALEFRCLKELHIRNLVVRDEDLKTLARTHGKDLRSLKISKCEGFSTDGLRHVSKYCNQLRTLCLKYSDYINVEDGTWFHQLALNSTVLERLHVSYTDISYTKDLTLLAKNCCNSLISLKIGKCYLSKLGDAFRYAVRLEHFSGDNSDEESDLVGFKFPQNMCSINIEGWPVSRFSIVFPFLNQIRKLKLVYLEMDKECHCLLFKRCPNLEVLYTEDGCGDTGLQVISKFCKKLRKLTHKGGVTHVGLISLAKGCTNLESLEVFITDISSEALDKLERLDIRLRHGELTDVGLEYIGKYGVNLRSLSVTRIGNFNVGLVKLSQGCQNLRKLKLFGCPFSEQDVTSYVFNIRSLRCKAKGSLQQVTNFMKKGRGLCNCMKDEMAKMKSKHKKEDLFVKTDILL
ncbi:leucine-rich repeat, cysteine-containing subtype protein [Tanacetum coccineum]|uniref:Leucine-rich repeat, cysteine-containing subtype protein n=1 Tax=Tanacetum coccineum TaxID=301880 RepID=A0ABQ5I9W8_9ASTR